MELETGIAFVVLVAVAAMVKEAFFSERAELRRAFGEVRPAPIAEARAGDLVKIIGRVRLIGEPLRAPLSGKACVFFEVTVKEHSLSSQRGSQWEEIIRETDAADFLVEDDTGRALVKTNGLRVLSMNDTERETGFIDKARPEMEAFLARHGGTSTGWILNKSLRFKEGLLESGERVAVLGRVTWEQDPDPSEAGTSYRDAPKRLVISAPADGHPFLASNDPAMT